MWCTRGVRQLSLRVVFVFFSWCFRVGKVGQASRCFEGHGDTKYEGNKTKQLRMCWMSSLESFNRRFPGRGQKMRIPTLCVSPPPLALLHPLAAPYVQSVPPTKNPAYQSTFSFGVRGLHCGLPIRSGSRGRQPTTVELPTPTPRDEICDDGNFVPTPLPHTHDSHVGCACGRCNDRPEAGWRTSTASI